MLKRFVRIFGGDPNKREIDKNSAVVDQVNSLEGPYEKLSDEALRAKTDEFRARLAEGEELDDILPEAFAAVREASKRTIGLRHYDVQLIGGIALHSGKIAEMRTGEGKTLVATLPLYLNALTGRGVHLITVNDYLARRDARWMAPIYQMLGMTVGVLQMAARTENGRKAFLVDLERESPHEDQNQLLMVPRSEAYSADITYGTNSEFGFDYLRDNMTMRLEDRVQRGHYYAIIDEVDNVLIDEARTPLIISGPAQDEAEFYYKMAQVVRQLRPEDYEIEEKDRTVTLTEIGETHVEEVLGEPLRDPDRPEDITHEQARLLGYLEQALRAQFLFRRNKDYLVQAGKVVIVDEFTGRLMPGRRWSDGLHQAVEAKEGVKVESESVTYATITIQNYFRMYDKLAGMTGTAMTEAEEFNKIYKLDVLSIPTNLEYQAMREETGLVEVESKDESGYKYSYYTRKDDLKRKPIFWRRQDYPDVVYRTEEAKLRSIAQEILHYHVLGRPLLVGTTSVEMSERLSARLRAEPLRRLAQTLLLRSVWFEKSNREEDGRQAPELQFLNAPLEKLDPGEMRKFSRELGMSFNPEDPDNLDRLTVLLGLPKESKERLVNDLQAGIPHEVLNARKHAEESQIITGAGAFGAVTIATNMAGRGVDIKLGGELAEEITSAVCRVLSKAGYADPFDMPLEERRKALQKMDRDDWGIHEPEVAFFLEQMENMERVRALGGLHVIGSERHEARRIDNQLRGRAARQGDPGSSRFYLSMEDELMRLFGGGQADNLMQRLKIDDAMPIEVGLVSRIVEQSQTRVEGANFDVRKHLLEYDDVLNTQRAKIYGQRNLIFQKDDLSEDVTEMLRAEVTRRVPESLQDKDGPWKLLSWLESIQPPLPVNNELFPSYSLRLVTDEIMGKREAIGSQEALEALQNLVAASLKAEEEHLLTVVNEQLMQTEERLESQAKERLEAVETFFEGLEVEEEGEERRPADLANELTGLTHLPLKLTPEQQRWFKTDPDRLEKEVRTQVEFMVSAMAIARLVGAVERRLEESLEVGQLPANDWDAVSDQILESIEKIFQRRRERFLDESSSTGGQIVRELKGILSKGNGAVNRAQLQQLLTLMPQGARTTFDKKTHRRMIQRTTRLTYFYHAAHLLENQAPDDVAADVLEHLQGAEAAIRLAWGQAEWKRLSAIPISQLDDKTQRGLQNSLGDDLFNQISGGTLQALSSAERERAADALGRQALTEIYRQLMLNVVTDLWVDYLTQMEALRVSIGLEAYAQRDPLVQYKNRAFGLFQDLLNNMRLGVVTRMFTYRPRDLSTIQAQSESRRDEGSPTDINDNAIGEETPAQTEEAVVAGVEPSTTQQTSANQPGESTSKKRRRRRR